MYILYIYNKCLCVCVCVWQLLPIDDGTAIVVLRSYNYYVYILLLYIHTIHCIAAAVTIQYIILYYSISSREPTRVYNLRTYTRSCV